MVALALGYGASFALSGSNVPRGVHVAGVDLGGMSESEARAAVERALLPLAARSVALVADGQRLTLDPARAGLAVDVETTLDDAFSAGPAARLRGLLGARRDIEPGALVDRAKLEGQLVLVAKGFDRPPREGAVRFRDSLPFAVLPERGRTLDTSQAADEVEDGWPAAESIEVAVETVDVKSTAAAVESALTDVAVPAVAGPVEVAVDGKVLQVRPADIAVSLALEAGDDGTITPDLQGDKLLTSLTGRRAAIEQKALDATFDVSSGKPVVVAGKDGKALDPVALATAVSSVLTDPPPRRTTTTLVVSPPRVTTELAKTLGVKERVGTFTTFHPCCRPRVNNIHRMADIVDGHVVLPGETYSLNGFVGERDRKRGFVEAPQILEGQFVNRVGGGVSQFATTLYNATFFAGMQDVEHKPHSYFISRYPAGREATVSFPQPDLKWKNDSPHGALITTSYTSRSITVSIWGTKRYDEVLSVSSPRTRMRTFGTQYITRADCTSASGANGFDITITRVFKKGGVEVKRDSYRHRYLPEPRFICGPPPRRASSSPSSSPAPSPSPSG